MIQDADGKAVQLISSVHYSNVVTVKYSDGTEKDLSYADLRSTLGPHHLAKEVRKVRPK